MNEQAYFEQFSGWDPLDELDEYFSSKKERWDDFVQAIFGIVADIAKEKDSEAADK